MSLSRITFTGADNTVSAEQLYALSQKYSFVEWGILISTFPRSISAPRFPSALWLNSLCNFARHSKMNLSLHLCGGAVEDTLNGYPFLPPNLLSVFERIQLNFHGYDYPVCPIEFGNVLKQFSQEIIFQIDGKVGSSYLAVAELQGYTKGVPLFDASGGAGILPKSWPLPGSLNTKAEYFGYAGGLGPDNLESELTTIDHITRQYYCWVDVETKVRNKYDEFDLVAVEECLKIAKQFIEGD